MVLAARGAPLLGSIFLSLRAISFIASIGSFLWIYRILKSETRSNWTGVLSVGIFAATYPMSGGWFDVGRVDSLLLFFLLGAIYFLRFAPSRRGYFAAGILLWLAFLTKQVAFVIGFPWMVCAAWTRRREAPFFIIPLV